MLPAGFEPTISAGERPLGPAIVTVLIGATPLCLFNIHEVFYSVTTQYTIMVNNTRFWLHVLVHQTILRAISYEGSVRTH